VRKSPPLAITLQIRWSHLILALIGLAFWVFLGSAFAQTPRCASGDVRVMLRPIAQTTSMCELAGARRGAYACTIPAGPDQPATVLFPTPDSTRMSFHTLGWAFDHEIQHALCGLEAERH
jgi:hypothetical protein